MKFFRLKDPQTGLYYCPSRDVKVLFPDGKEKYVKSNLSKKGKIYCATYDSNIRTICDHTQIVKDRYGGNRTLVRGVQFEVEYVNEDLEK